MANEEHVSLLREGVSVWNDWRRGTRSVPDLEGADLRRLPLLGVDLSRARLARANLSEAVLSLADLSDADLRDATLLDARLVQARLPRCRLGGAVLARAQIIDTDLTGADLTSADLAYASLIGVDLSNATLDGCIVYGIGAWDITTDDRTRQHELVVSRPDEPRVSVDDIEIAQLVRLFMTHAKIRNAINAVADRGVLLLGRFSGGGLALLRALAARFRDEGYLPMLFDFERPEARNYTETVQTLAGLSRFVVADLSGPSIPQELYATVPHFKIPFVPLIGKDRPAFAMFTDLLEYPWVLDPVPYTDTSDLLASLKAQVIEPAETRHAARQARLDRLFSQ